MTITQQELVHFTGTNQYYYLPQFPEYRYTDGVRYLVHNGLPWLVNDIFLYQNHKAIQAYLKTDYFQHWTLTVKEERGTLICDDGNGTEIYKKEGIGIYTPLPEISLYLIDKVLMLPSEY